MSVTRLALLCFVLSALAACGAAPAPGPAPGPALAEPVVEAGGRPNAWFEFTELDLGTFPGAKHAVGQFEFQNPNDREILWRGLRGSCACGKAVIRVGDRHYELTPKPRKELVRISRGADGVEHREKVEQIAIGPREEGVVEVHIDIPNVAGVREAQLDGHTTDVALPQFKLMWKGRSAKHFLVSPAEIRLDKMTWNEVREFTATVTSPVHTDFNIVGLRDPVEGFDVEFEKGVFRDRTRWTIRGRYGPMGPEAKGGGGILTFVTDVAAQRSAFPLRVVASVEGPLQIRPGTFLSLGLIRHGEGLKKEVVFEPNDGIELEATALTLEKLTVAKEFLLVETRNDGNRLIVEVGVTKTAPLGLLKGELVVGLNHPLIKHKRIRFNGFVR